jgi:hypothetical protein
MTTKPHHSPGARVGILGTPIIGQVMPTHTCRKKAVPGDFTSWKMNLMIGTWWQLFKTRVTRMGEFSPKSWLFTLDNGLILTKMGWAIFLPNSSCHPVQNQDRAPQTQIECMYSGICRMNTLKIFSWDLTNDVCSKWAIPEDLQQFIPTDGHMKIHTWWQ